MQSSHSFSLPHNISKKTPPIRSLREVALTSYVVIAPEKLEIGNWKIEDRGRGAVKHELRMYGLLSFWVMGVYGVKN